MIFEVEFAAGLLSIVQDEVQSHIGEHGRIIGSPRSDALQFTYEGNPADLQSLGTVIAVYEVLEFDIPRPKALLGHQHWQRLINTITPIIESDTFRSLYISAAGSNSAVMTRIKQTLSVHFGLIVAEPEGDLLLRIRRTAAKRAGWDVLVRTTPRPLSTRDWRICNYEGALNASVAASIVRLTDPQASDIFLNIGCGSGTMMIERACYGPARLISGVDLSREALECSHENFSAGHVDHIVVYQADAIQLPFPPGFADRLTADLPFGQLVGSHEENEWLYPAILTEAARIAQPGAIFVVITHEIRLMERVLSESPNWRQVEEPLMVSLSGLHPRIYVLERL